MDELLAIFEQEDIKPVEQPLTKTVQQYNNVVEEKDNKFALVVEKWFEARKQLKPNKIINGKQYHYNGKNVYFLIG
jgi:hypothetical protein